MAAEEAAKTLREAALAATEADGKKKAKFMQVS
jgi:hypothetical protein